MEAGEVLQRWKYMQWKMVVKILTMIENYKSGG